MKRLKSSIIAWSLSGALISFVGLYYAIPYQKHLDLALSLAFGVSLAGTIKYGRDAIKAVRHGRSGAEFLIVSVFAWFTITLGQRVWAIVLSVTDRPDWLANSVVSILVPWMLAWAMSLALIAPDVDLEPEDARAGLWRSVALFIGGALAGVIIASSFALNDSVSLPQYSRTVNRPSCPVNAVLVSSRGVYHTVNSPYRRSVVARMCFANEQDAKHAGFRPPK